MGSYSRQCRHVHGSTPVVEAPTGAPAFGEGGRASHRRGSWAITVPYQMPQRPGAAGGSGSSAPKRLRGGGEELEGGKREGFGAVRERSLGPECGTLWVFLVGVEVAGSTLNES